VDTTSPVIHIFNDMEEAHTDRRFKRYNLSRHLNTQNLAISNNPQVEISDSFIFSLFKDELGYAERINVSTEEVKSMKLFNLHYIIPAN
jgi:hypothetical protein